jgi:hypothetical protein
MADEGEAKQVKKKGWQPKRADWREGAQQVCVSCVLSLHCPFPLFHVRVCLRACARRESNQACTPAGAHSQCAPRRMPSTRPSAWLK